MIKEVSKAPDGYVMILLNEDKKDYNMKCLPSCFGINGAIICIATLFLAERVDLAEYLGLFC